MQNKPKPPMDSSDRADVIRTVGQLCTRAIKHLPHDITMDDILQGFYQPEHIETCKLAGMLSVNQQNYETWTFEAIYNKRKITIVTEDKSVLRPDYIVLKRNDLSPYLEGRLADWLTNAGDILDRQQKFGAAFDMMLTKCKTLSQITFYWPTLASLGFDPNHPLAKRVAKAVKVSPTERPPLDPDTKKALRDMTTLIHAARLMPDDIPKLPVSVFMA